MGRAAAAPRAAINVLRCDFWSLLGSSHLGVGSNDGHFQRNGVDLAFFPGFVGQDDARLAGGDGVWDLDQVL